jgi:hypothetical protein
LHAVEGSGQVDGHGAVPLLEGDVGERLEGGDAGAGDDYLDGPKLVTNGGHRSIDRRPLGDIDFEPHGLKGVVLQGRYVRLQCVALLIEDGHPIPALGQTLADRLADAGGSAGDHGNSAHKFSFSRRAARLTRPA